MKRCLGCMEEYDDSYVVCPHCGYVEGTQPEEAIHMIPGTVLNNRFIVGKVVGFGGFGVTYIAWDTVLQHRVAIKEYLPSEFSTRIPGQTQITIFDGEKHEQYQSGLERFVEEAKKLAKFNDTQGIVKIYDSFTENDTAYIVMEYLEGETLDKILKREKTVSPEQAVQMLMPIMESLKRVHQEGIIHRDIAPDNVMVTVDGEMKLIDFGAARYATTSHSRSLTVIIKPGYSPEEQYRSRGDQGPHTDVYAVGAVLYRMITGITPPDAFERRAFFESKKKDILEPIKKYCKNIPENIENAILNAMNVRIEDRSSDMTVLINELTTDEPVKRVYGKIKKIDVLRWPLWAKIAVPLAACSVIVLGVLFALGIIGFKSDLQNEIIIPDGMTRVPTVVNKYLNESESILSEAELMYTFEDKQQSDVIPKDYVLWQSINPGQITEVNSEISIIVSAGPELVKVETVEGLSREEAVKLLEDAGFKVTYIEEYDNSTAAGHIISQSIEGEEYIAKGSSIQILVSKGKDPAVKVEEKNIKAPEFVGLTYDEARALAVEHGITISVLDRKYSAEYEADVIMAQSVEAGTDMVNTEEIQLTVSLGIRQVRVPDITLESEEEAIALLEQNELVYEIERENHENVKEGLVISQSIEDGEMVAPGTTIKIVISKGRTSFEMPDVIGMKEDEAKSLLKGKGLAVTITYSNSETVASGNVISQSIEKSTQVTAGTAVSIEVSSGEKLYTVPDVLGKKEKAAVESLENLKFKIQVNTAYDENIPEGCVVAQSLAAGTQYKKNTDIIITVSKGKQPLNITFDGNGGVCDSAPKIVYLNGTYGDMPTATREYFTFAGWYTAASGGSLIESTSTVAEKSDQTLYAHWVRNSVSIIYDMGDGTVYYQVGAFQGDNYAHPINPTKQNYTFKGWFTTASGGTQIKAGDIITATGSQRLYAQWTRNTLNVKFDAVNGETSSKTLNQGDKYTLPANPTKTGYIFQGWYTAASVSSGTQVTAATTVTKTGSETLYAHWAPITYNITYDKNHKDASGSTASSTHTYDMIEDLTANGYSRTGYTFESWSDGKNNYYGDKQSVCNLATTQNATVKLWVKWKANTYTVKYDGNGATGGSTAQSSHTYDAEKALTANGYSKTGYTFQGWSTNKNATSATYTNSQKVKNLTATNGGTVTLYAVWKANTYTVTFNSQSGTSVSSKNVNYNGTINQLPTTTRTYYTFNGWYTETNGSGTKLTTSTKITGNVTYYAYWTANQWSSWSSSLPSGVNKNSTDYEIQYRYKQLQYTNWVVQGYTATPQTETNVYKLTGITKSVETAWKTQYNYYGYTFRDGQTYYTYCIVANNLGYSPTYIETGWIDNNLSQTIDAYDAYTTHGCNNSKCTAVQGGGYYATWKYGSHRYYLRNERTVATAWQTQYEYQTRSSYWPDNWTNSNSAVTASSEVMVEYRYKKK